MNRSRRTAGTSLVEILVVIVVFLIGILAIVQIFPGGFRLLGLTASQSKATQLARKEIERLKSRADQLPDRIVPVRYVRATGELVAIVDSLRRTNDLGPTADSLTQGGNFFFAGDDLGPWRRGAGANTVTRIVGESSIIPAPRPAAGALSDQFFYGGLMTLQFGPAVFNPEVGGNSANNDVVFNVYGNDLSLALGASPVNGSPGPFREYLYFCANPELTTAEIHIPRAGIPVRYRFAATIYVRDAALNVRTLEILDQILTVNNLAGDDYDELSLAALVAPLLLPGDTFIGVAFDSLQLAPLFERIPKANSFSVGDPYEYKLIDDVNVGVTNANMGALLFNPAGYKYFVPNSQGRRIPLTARVNYNVYDWGIVREEFRIPSGTNDSTKLVLNGLKVKGNADTDGRTYNGLGFNVPNGAGGNQELDVVVQDTETGGIYAHNPANLADPLQTAYRVDKSIGSVKFQDRDLSTPEMEVTLYRPDDWTPIQIDDARGRSVRVYYQSTQEYQVQVMKSAARYIGVSGIPGSGQCSIGSLADPLQATKLYFSNSELGRSVTINEAYVRWDLDGPGPGLTTEVRKVSVSGAIKAPNALDPVQQPYLDLSDVYGAGWAVTWSDVDETGKAPGYIMRGVRGSSVAVRVLWNPQKFSLGTDTTANMTAFDRWASNWRKATTETFLQKGGIQ
ncbi:MAG: hypothetical protein H7Y17_05265 [Chlorobia bacterium]|nr:hypothetical protein [Fimbriimonadaceae bacterium]